MLHLLTLHVVGTRCDNSPCYLSSTYSSDTGMVNDTNIMMTCCKHLPCIGCVCRHRVSERTLLFSRSQSPTRGDAYTARPQHASHGSCLHTLWWHKPSKLPYDDDALIRQLSTIFGQNASAV